MKNSLRERIAEIVEMVANYYFYKRVPPSNVPAMNKDDAMNKLYALLTPSVEGKCPECYGKGYLKTSGESIQCYDCNGTGKVESKQPTSEVEWIPEATCSKHTYRENDSKCEECNRSESYNFAVQHCLSAHQQILAQKDEAWRKKENEIITHYETKIDDCRIKIEQNEKEIAELEKENEVLREQNLEGVAEVNRKDAEITRLRTALEKLLCYEDYEEIVNIAREALSGKDGDK